MANLSPLFRGDSREYSLSFTDSEGAKIDITGWKVYFTLKKNESDGDSSAQVTKDVTEHEAPTEGRTKIVLVPSDTDSLEPGDYHYDIQVKTANGSILTVAKGRMSIKADITRRAD